MIILSEIMQVELDEEQLEFLAESLRYAQISYENSISKYPQVFKAMYYKRFYPEKIELFRTVMEKLHDVKKSKRTE